LVGGGGRGGGDLVGGGGRGGGDLAGGGGGGLFLGGGGLGAAAARRGTAVPPNPAVRRHSRLRKRTSIAAKS
jgi:hypothetical protein